jgi:hypothetical protein
LAKGVSRTELVPLSLKSYEPQIRRCALLTVFFSVPAWLAFTKTSVLDPDVWWHIRTGQWIVAHHWVPYHDWFSNYGIGKPWAAYSWLFEVLLYLLFSRFGLVGLVIYVYALMLAITGTFFMLVRKYETRLAQSILIAAAGVFALAHMRTPRPWLFTILCFAIELNILVSVRRTRNYRHLFWLVALFALWANLHIQFVYGLFVLGLAALEEPLNVLIRREPTTGPDRPLPFRWSVAMIAACALAVIANPYHFRIYGWVIDTIRLSGLDQFVGEMQAMDFRSLTDWLVLGLTVATIFRIGRRPQLNLFWLLLLAAGIFLAFRSKRDVWFLASTTITILPLMHSAVSITAADQISRAQIVAVLVASVALVFLAASVSRFSNSTLQQSVAKEYPVAAADFVDRNRLSGPLYNYFDWGGYLIWRLPTLPVAIDGRSNIHRIDRIKQSAAVWNGEPGWESDAELSSARLVIAEKQLPLSQLLRQDKRFKNVYEDEIAVVFVRQ